MTIYEIKGRVTNAPYFFARSSMKFFNQTLKDFKVSKIGDNLYKLTAPMRDFEGRNMGVTVRIFNAITNEFVNEA